MNINLTQRNFSCLLFCAFFLNGILKCYFLLNFRHFLLDFMR